MAQKNHIQYREMAGYACAAPRGGDSRRFEVSKGSGLRTAFQRDCDRIVHSTSFRLLMHKTQVFVAPVSGQFRTRLTHTIEVARVARALASALRLNPDLAESVSLAHDLGHPPFGHIGEQTLSQLMAGRGGFEHNAQAIRIVTELERSYMDYNGLNLTWETLEGIAKHNGPIFENIPSAIAKYNEAHHLELHSFPSAEAQVAAVADDIAYNCHDLQDGLRAGLFHQDELDRLPLVGPAFAWVRAKYVNGDPFRIAQTALRRVFDELTDDVVKESLRRLARYEPESVEDVRRFDQRSVQFSANCFDEMKTVREFLFDRMYRNDQVKKECDAGSEAIKGLFIHYTNHPQDLPLERRKDYQEAETQSHQFRSVADHISGLADGFALNEYSRIANGR